MDYRGFYVFDEVFFGRWGVFDVNVRNMGQFIFLNWGLRDILNNEELISRLFNFIFGEIFFNSFEGSIVIDIVVFRVGIDEFFFEWVY